MGRLGNKEYKSPEYEGEIYTNIEGNVVRKLQALPERKSAPEYEEEQVKRISNKTQNNRKKALQTGKGFVLFLGFICVCTLYFCVEYLQSRSTITNQLKTIATLETTLSGLKAENDALYDKTLASVDLEKIKEVAMDRLNMQYANKDQVIWYSVSGNSYFRQYQDVPSDK